MTAAAAPAPEERTGGLLDIIEKVGNRVPHPVLMFLYLIIGVIVLSAILALLGVSVTDQIAVPIPIAADPVYVGGAINPVFEGPGYGPDTHFEIQQTTIAIQSLISIEGIRFVFSSFVSNFTGFSVVGVTFVALMGAGVAEAAGLMDSLIRKLVAVSPKRLLAFILILVGVLSSVASDAGYLILIPLGAAAFMSVGRHPLAGLAACFAGVAAIFGVNLLLGPVDAMITEITNEALALVGGEPITIVSNLWFAIVSSIVLAITAAIITERIVEPRLGAWEGADAWAAGGDTGADEKKTVDAAADSKGLKWAGLAVLGALAVVLVLTLPPGAPLRDPATGDIVGQTPFMDSLLFIITMTFLVAGIGYGFGARTFTSSNDVIAAVTKTFAGLAGLVFMLLMISQFIAIFNFSQLPNVIAIGLSQFLETAGIGALPLLVGLILVIVMLDLIMPGLVPKWAIFAPIFVPLFIQLGVPAQTVLAAYRVGDSPFNTLTPLMVYLPFIVTIAQRYQKGAGIGTIIALMLPYALILLGVWIVLFVAWYLLGLPLGPGYPVAL
jgi:aminobenzoyl-glutamate transport protein